jgi:hypothetical protein
MDSTYTLVPSGSIKPPSHAGLKWFLILVFGLVVVLGSMIAAFYFTHSDQMGVTVVRMEGTMVTGCRKHRQ